MGYDEFDNYECEGQISIEGWLADVEIPENVFAVSKIFAQARKTMNLPEYKAFVYALANLKFTGNNSNRLLLDKKTLAKIVGVNSDIDHLSENLKRSIGQLPQHSFIEIDDIEANDFYESGVLITSLRMYKNNAAITFNPDYMPMFNNLQRDYITMWSGDIYQMHSERSIAFYEYLRLHSDTRKINEAGMGIKKLKELFNIPKDGPGSYMREKSGFDRTQFERRVIDPLCEDLARCQMINLIVQPDGKYYEKVKEHGRVRGYRFHYTISDRPRIVSASEMAEIREDIIKNPVDMKILADIKKGKERKQNKQGQRNFSSERNYTQQEMDELERRLLQKQKKGE